jgi:hypothetical protein
MEWILESRSELDDWRRGRRFSISAILLLPINRDLPATEPQEQDDYTEALLTTFSLR